MYVYIIVKLISEFLGLYFNIKLKNLFMFIESMIIVGYFYLLYLKEININKYLLIWCIGWVIFFVSYKSMNYLYENRSKIVEKIKQKVSRWELVAR